MILHKLNRTMLSTSTCGFLVIVGTACSGGDIRNEESVGSVDSQLYYVGSSAHWSRDANHGGTLIGADVHICSDAHGMALTQTQINDVNDITTYAQGSWGMYADINFLNEGVCGANRNGKLVIDITTDPQKTTRCNFYQGANVPTIMTLRIDQQVCDNTGCRPMTALEKKVRDIHEIGHALGFYHEFSRSDWMPHSLDHLGVECNTDSDCTNDDYGRKCTAVMVQSVAKKICTNDAATGVKLSPSADYDSIMAATYTLMNAADQTGKLTPWDINGVREVYGSKPRLTWSAWQNMSESSNVPVGATGFNGFMHLFAVETNTTIAHNTTQDGFPWSSWTHELSGNTDAAVNATPFAGTLHLFAKGINGLIYHSFAAQGQAFSPWYNEISGSTNLALASAGLGNYLHLFRVDSGNNILHCSAATGQGFGAWQTLDGKTNQAIAAASLGNYMHLFAKDATNNRVYHRNAADGQPFGAWEDMGGTTNAAPAAAVVQHPPVGGSDNMILLRVGTDGHIYYRLAEDGFPFGEWLEIPGGATTTVVSAARLGANTYVFARASNGTIQVSSAHL